MTRDEILKEAARIISTDRADDYGPADESFKRIARLWTAYLDVAVSPMDVANMYILSKVQRTLHRQARATHGWTFADMRHWQGR